MCSATRGRSTSRRWGTRSAWSIEGMDVGMCVPWWVGRLLVVAAFPSFPGVVLATETDRAANSHPRPPSWPIQQDQPTTQPTRYTFVEDVKNAKACTVLIKGPNQHTIDQVRSGTKWWLSCVCACEGEGRRLFLSLRVCVWKERRVFLVSTLPPLLPLPTPHSYTHQLNPGRSRTPSATVCGP